MDQKVKQVRAQESYTTFAELPETYVDAVIAAEDHRFYQHNGIDVIAIGRAVVNDIKAMSFVEGGSTITQQLAKNLYFTQEKRLTRKAAEMFMGLPHRGQLHQGGDFRAVRQLHLLRQRAATTWPRPARPTLG